jgi:hypothetical protein
LKLIDLLQGGGNLSIVFFPYHNCQLLVLTPESLELRNYSFEMLKPGGEFTSLPLTNLEIALYSLDEHYLLVVPFFVY